MTVLAFFLGGACGLFAMAILTMGRVADLQAERDQARREAAESQERIKALEEGQRLLATSLSSWILAYSQVRRELTALQLAKWPTSSSELPS